MKNDIMFGILLELLNKGKSTTKELSSKFEMSTKTISRYINSLGLSGVPIISYLGKNGGYEIDPNFTLNNFYFSYEEVERLKLYLSATPVSGIDNVDKTLLVKLNFCNNTKNNFKSSEIIFIDKTCWSGEKLISEALKTINLAIRKKINLSFLYFGRNEVSERTISPLALFNKECKWYVIGYCHIRNDYRIFKISKIDSLALSSSAYHEDQIDNDFIKNLIDNSFTTKPIQLKISDNLLPDIEEWLEITYLEKENDFLIIKGNAIYNKGLINRIISYGDKIEVMSPQELKFEILELCRNINSVYSK